MTTKRDWVRIIGITGASLVLAGAVIMGGLWGATATGLITAPTMPMGKMGGHGGEMMGGRGGKMGGHGGEMMGGRGGMFAQSAGDEAVLTHLLMELQNEQAVASLLADTNTAAKAIAESRVKDVAALTELQKNWYPDAAIPTSTVTSATIDDLQELMLHNSTSLERLSNTTFEHPELATWIAQHITQRINETATLYAQ